MLSEVGSGTGMDGPGTCVAVNVPPNVDGGAHADVVVYPEELAAAGVWEPRIGDRHFFGSAPRVGGTAPSIFARTAGTLASGRRRMLTYPTARQ
jgi:hypothetical protein